MTGTRSLLRWRLSRVTSTGEFIPQIDGLRCLAVLLVIAHHVFAFYLVQTHRLGTRALPQDWGLIAPRSPLINWALHLVIGVPLFCAISGFVLAMPFARSLLAAAPPPSTAIYLLRRLIRLEAPYVLNMLFMFAVVVLPLHQTQPWAYFARRVHVFAPHLYASLGYLHAIVFGGPSWVNGMAWTLEIEVQFYLMLPAIAQIFRIRHAAWRRGTLVLLVLAAALLSQFVVQPSGSARLNLSLALQLQYFLAGLLLAEIYLTAPGLLRPRPRLADVLACLAAGLLVFVRHRAAEFTWTEPFLIVGLYAGVFYGKWAGALFRWPLLTVLGGMSYTTYLYHGIIIETLLPFSIRLLPPIHALWWDSGVQLLVMLVPIFAICAVFFVLTERPFMLLSREVARRFRAASGTTALINWSALMPWSRTGRRPS